MRSIATLLALTGVTSAFGGDFCERAPQVDLEFPAGLLGRYEIVGRLPNSESTYAGHLEVREGQAAYVVVRSVGDVTTTGEAWIEFCSPDRILQLAFRYDTGDLPRWGVCALGGDPGNYLRVTCHTRVDDGQSKHGLEAWFQLRPNQ